MNQFYFLQIPYQISNKILSFKIFEQLYLFQVNSHNQKGLQSHVLLQNFR